MSEKFNPLSDPISDATPAFQQMEAKLGEQGMAMLDRQLLVWSELNERQLASPLRDALKRGDTRLPKGTMLHSMGMHGFDAEAVRGVSQLGIMSGELVGKVEDSETHGCADFFRVPADTTIADYLTDAKAIVASGNIRRQKGERLLLRGVTFIVDAQAEGMADLLQNDGYTNEAMGSFVRTPDGRSAEDTAAVLGGVPRGAIAGILVSEKLFGSDGVADLLAQHFPDTPVLNHQGTMLPAIAA